MYTANSIHQPKEKSHPIDLTDDMFLYFSDMVISFVFVLGYILGYHVQEVFVGCEIAVEEFFAEWVVEHLLEGEAVWMQGQG